MGDAVNEEPELLPVVASVRGDTESGEGWYMCCSKEVPCTPRWDAGLAAAALTAMAAAACCSTGWLPGIVDGEAWCI